jgi:hypothetical protein
MLEIATVKLDAVEHVIFDEIIAERDPTHWTAHRRHLAALLAREIRMVNLNQEELSREGFVMTNGRGNPVLNPRARVVDQGIKSVIAYRRSLAITARALGGEARDIGRRREIRRDQQRDAPRDAENLIAQPGGDHD